MDSDDDWDLEGAIDMEAEFESEKPAPKSGSVVGELEEGQSVQSAGRTSTVSLSPCSSSSCGTSPPASSSSSPTVSDSHDNQARTVLFPHISLPVRQDHGGEPVRTDPCTSKPRKRLRAKTAITAAPQVERHQEAAVGIWEDYARMSFNGHRDKYFWFYKKFKSWVMQCIQWPEDSGQDRDALKRIKDADRDFRGMPAPEKRSVVELLLRGTSAPEELRGWAYVVWPQGAEAKKGRQCFVYSRQVLFTWNGSWGVKRSDYVAASATVDDIVQTVQGDPDAKELFESFRDFMEQKVQEFHVSCWGASMELCTQTWAEDKQVRLHLHSYWKAGNKFFMATPEPVTFRGSVPCRHHSIDVLQSRSTAGWCGMYYIQCPKIGMVFRHYTAAAHTAFPVSGDWVFGLLSSGKMTEQDARVELLRVGKGICRRMADLERLSQLRKEQRLQERIQHVRRVIEASSLEFHSYPAINAWKEQALRPYQRRKNFLVLEGESGLGKTEFVKGLFGVEKTLELNCANCGSHPDLRRFDADKHRCVLFDEGTVAMVAKNRKLFQAPAAFVDVGHSPTGRDVYWVFLNDAALVISSNKWSEQLNQIPAGDRDWIEKNQVMVVVTAPMYIT